MLFFFWLHIWADNDSRSFTVCTPRYCYSRIDDSGMYRAPRKH